MATDVDVSRLGGQARPYEVREHNVGIEPPPGQGFDLVHARLVLVHVPQREAALATIEEIEEHLANVRSGALDLAPSPLVFAWGRRAG